MAFSFRQDKCLKYTKFMFRKETGREKNIMYAPYPRPCFFSRNAVILRQKEGSSQE